MDCRERREWRCGFRVRRRSRGHRSPRGSGEDGSAIAGQEGAAAADHTSGDNGGDYNEGGAEDKNYDSCC